MTYLLRLWKRCINPPMMNMEWKLVVYSVETFNSLFCLRLSHLLFSGAEQLSLTLQKKISLQDISSLIQWGRTAFTNFPKKEISLQDIFKAVEAANLWTINEYDQTKLLIDFMRSQPILLKNILLISQSYHNIENVLHDLKTGVNNINTQHRKTTVVTSIMKLVTFYMLN